MPLTCSRSTRRSVCSTMAPIHPTIFIICTADLFIIRNLLPFLRSAEFRQLYAGRLLSVCVDQIFHLFNSQIAAQYFYISPLDYTQTHQPTKNAAPSSLLGRKKQGQRKKLGIPRHAFQRLGILSYTFCCSKICTLCHEAVVNMIGELSLPLKNSCPTRSFEID